MSGSMGSLLLCIIKCGRGFVGKRRGKFVLDGERS